MDTHLEDKIRNNAAYSASQTISQLREGEPAPEEMPDSFVDAEKDALAVVMGGFSDKAWEIYKEQWEQEMKAHNRRRGNAIG